MGVVSAFSSQRPGNPVGCYSRPCQRGCFRLPDPSAVGTALPLGFWQRYFSFHKARRGCQHSPPPQCSGMGSSAEASSGFPCPAPAEEKHPRETSAALSAPLFFFFFFFKLNLPSLSLTSVGLCCRGSSHSP